MRTVQDFTKQASFLRESSGSTNIEKALMKALKVLTLFNIPHSVCGGFAVQDARVSCALRGKGVTIPTPSRATQVNRPD